jgi:hypothetical protein
MLTSADGEAAGLDDRGDYPHAVVCPDEHITSATLFMGGGRMYCFSVCERLLERGGSKPPQAVEKSHPETDPMLGSA